MFPVDNLRLPLVAYVFVAAVVAVSSIPSLALWHARLSYLPLRYNNWLLEV